jgi:hypothetical protein
MHGCVQANWLELLTKVLQEAQYKHAAMDLCIICRIDGLMTHVIVI